MMSFNAIIFSILWVLTLVVIFVIAWFIIKPYLEEKNIIRDKETKNKKFEIFNSVNIEDTTKNIDDYFEAYVNRYIIYKFASRRIDYIKEDSVELMINEVSKSIFFDIPELYVFYISLTRSINNDDDLFKYIYTKTKEIVIASVSNYNTSAINL